MTMALTPIDALHVGARCDAWHNSKAGPTGPPRISRASDFHDPDILIHHSTFTISFDLLTLYSTTRGSYMVRFSYLNTIRYVYRTSVLFSKTEHMYLRTLRG